MQKKYVTPEYREIVVVITSVVLSNELFVYVPESLFKLTGIIYSQRH